MMTAGLLPDERALHEIVLWESAPSVATPLAGLYDSYINKLVAGSSPWMSAFTSIAASHRPEDEPHQPFEESVSRAATKNQFLRPPQLFFLDMPDPFEYGRYDRSAHSDCLILDAWFIRYYQHLTQGNPVRLAHELPAFLELFEAKVHHWLAHWFEHMFFIMLDPGYHVPARFDAMREVFHVNEETQGLFGNPGRWAEVSIKGGILERDGGDAQYTILIADARGAVGCFLVGLEVFTERSWERPVPARFSLEDPRLQPITVNRSKLPSCPHPQDWRNIPSPSDVSSDGDIKREPDSPDFSTSPDNKLQIDLERQEGPSTKVWGLRRQLSHTSVS